ncbi:MAG: hypothetical protein P1V97_13365 [Planctomycetota bacterium]|nr:hypothetical protein [Planctomycetota bacterium]
MKLRLLFSLSLVCIGATVALAQDKKDALYKIEHSFKKGEERQYRVTVKQSLSLDDTTVKMSAKETFLETCQSYDATKKTAILEIKKKHLLLSRERGGKVEKFDSRDPNSKLPGLDKNAAAQLLKTLKLPVKLNGSIERRRPRVIGADLLRPFLLGLENCPYDFIRFSDKAIKVGAQWKQTLARTEKDPSNLTTTFSTQFNYTLKSVSTSNAIQLAVISFKTKTKVTIIGEFDGPEFKKSEGHGTFVFNMTDGRLRSLQYSHDIVAGDKKSDMKVNYRFRALCVGPSKKARK